MKWLPQLPSLSWQLDIHWMLELQWSILAGKLGQFGSLCVAVWCTWTLDAAFDFVFVAFGLP